MTAIAMPSKPEPLQTPVAEWRETAARFRRYGGEEMAVLLERCAEEFEAWLTAHQSEALPLVQAAAESGYSEDHLGRMIRDGMVANVGRKHAPRIRRGDLPKKPGTAPAAKPSPVPAAGALMLSITRDAMASRSRSS